MESNNNKNFNNILNFYTYAFICQQMPEMCLFLVFDITIHPNTFTKTILCAWVKKQQLYCCPCFIIHVCRKMRPACAIFMHNLFYAYNSYFLLVISNVILLHLNGEFHYYFYLHAAYENVIITMLLAAGETLPRSFCNKVLLVLNFTHPSI